ncbi:MAG: protein kinase [Luteitalea sp.]|nr:protein kinase [Luteitalea sp.]
MASPVSEVETGTSLETAPWAKTLLARDRGTSASATGLPADLLTQSARRLRIVALLYAVVFFMSNPLTAILFPEERVQFLASVVRWGPSTVSITVALLVAAATWNRGLAVGTVLTAGLVFEVAGSFGIATAQYLDVGRYSTTPPWAGLSWVAVWMLGFTVMIPNPPRRALLAALASASSVPLVVTFVMATQPFPFEISPLRFFVLIVLPYLLVVLIADVGARVVYRLGTELKRARSLGSYQLVERLGSGGMGEVWLARHRLLARPAAIKLMRPEVIGGSSPDRQSELHERFEREAQATSSLRSPHTIQLYDFGVADNGVFYYVMELLDGFDLEALVGRFGPLQVERAVHLLQQVCHSLAEAHAAGLIHRDIKPANVYVCRYGRDVDFVKVLDFGLVKSQDEARLDIGITAGHAVGGTPAFMSPEQVVSDQPLDGRSDIYALGCLAYWLVTGELVFQGRTVMDTILQHRQATPAPPSHRTELAIPEAFDRLILDCLSKRPDDRPATAEDVLARLTAIETRAAWTPEQARQWWDLHHP